LRSIPRRRGAPTARPGGRSRLSVSSYRFGEIARRRALFFRQPIGGLAPAQHRREFVRDCNEEDNDAEDEAELRYPDRNLHETLGDFMVLPAFVYKAHDGPGHVSGEDQRDRQGEHLGAAACPLIQHFQPESDPHQLTPAKRVAQREKCSRRREPRDDVIRAADEYARAAAERLSEHQRANRREAESGTCTARRIEDIERAPHEIGFLRAGDALRQALRGYFPRYALIIAAPSGPAAC